MLVIVCYVLIAVISYWLGGFSQFHKGFIAGVKAQKEGKVKWKI